MATSSSRMQMTNLRDRNSNYEQREPSPAQYFDNNNYSDQLSSGLKLSLPEEQNAGYEPTTSTGVAFQTRTATRILKGKFDRGSSKDQKFQSTATSCTRIVIQKIKGYFNRQGRIKARWSSREDSKCNNQMVLAQVS